MAALLPPEAPKVQLRLYTSAELSRATQNFARDRLIGQGATGEVFRGTTNGNKDDIAVKRLKLPPGANAITRQDLMYATQTMARPLVKASASRRLRQDSGATTIAAKTIHTARLPPPPPPTTRESVSPATMM